MLGRRLCTAIVLLSAAATPPPPPASGACVGKRCHTGYDMIDLGDRCVCRPPRALSFAARRARAGLSHERPFWSGNETQLQTQLSFLAAANQVAVVSSQRALSRLGFFSESLSAWAHAENELWSDVRVQFVELWGAFQPIPPIMCRAKSYELRASPDAPPRQCDAHDLTPPECSESSPTPDACIKLVLSTCRTTAELRECFNHTNGHDSVGELPIGCRASECHLRPPACCLARIGSAWVDRYPFPPMDIPGYIRQTLAAQPQGAVVLDANPWVRVRAECPIDGCPEDVAKAKEAKAKAKAAKAAKAAKKAKAKTTAKQGPKASRRTSRKMRKDEDDDEEEEDDEDDDNPFFEFQRSMLSLMSGMMKDAMRPLGGEVPEFDRAYSPTERASFGSKPKPTSADVYNHDAGRREWGVPVPRMHQLASADQHQAELAEALREVGASPDERDPGTQAAPLHFAAKHAALAAAYSLVESGADVDLVDETGFSPLMLVCSYRTNDVRPGHSAESISTRIKLIKLLLEQGVRTRAVTRPASPRACACGSVLPCESARC